MTPAGWDGDAWGRAVCVRRELGDLSLALSARMHGGGPDEVAAAFAELARVSLVGECVALGRTSASMTVYSVAPVIEAIEVAA